MKQIQINLFEGTPSTESTQQTSERPQKKRPFLLTKPGILVLSFFLFVTAGSTLSYHYSQDANSKLNKTLGFLGQIKQFAENRNKTLEGEKDDRINILIMGMGGKYHEGSYLTDTIMIASIKPSTKQVSLVSLPRDLQVEIPGYGWRKINNANAFGEINNEGYGAELARQVVEKSFDMDIHYYIRIDFTGFEEIVDSLNGIDVMVDSAFTDYQYPTEDKKYQIVSFRAGPQTMYGEEALKYARSRHSGMNGEGSDFARSKRQQKNINGL